MSRALEETRQEVAAQLEASGVQGSLIGGRLGEWPLVVLHEAKLTLVRVRIPVTTLALYVRAHRPPDAADVAAGVRTDVRVAPASEKFDERFLVEGAPADVVRVLLDERTRAELAADAAVELNVGGTSLEVSRRGDGPMDADGVLALIALAVKIAMRTADVFRAADAAAIARGSGSPYRTANNAQGYVAALHEQRVIEMDRLLHTIARRDDPDPND